MPPKRKAETEEVTEPRHPRAAKAAKTSAAVESTKDNKAKEKATKGKKKPLLSKEEFKAGAMPLHMSLTHAPPPIDQPSAESQAPGFLGHVVLPPTVFSTKSYGWKGSKRLLVELENPNGPANTKVWVQLNINATVMGSKPADEEDSEAEKAASKEEAKETADDE